MAASFSRIFVSIAAYRDRDCPNTIRDLFAKAAHPERISIGLCWQGLSPEDDDCDPVGAYAAQCRVLRFDAAISKGVCWARHHVQSLWEGEEYCLQIDSHMRFVRDWDAKMLRMLAECPGDRPILTNYPAAFTPPDIIESHVVSVIYAQNFDRDGMVAQNSIGHPPESMTGPPQPARFCAGGFLFGDSRWIREVPYDPHLYFLGEETSLAVRLFTHGWDMFTPNDVLLYHDYGNRPERPRHWKDRPDWSSLNDLSYRRVRHLLDVAPSTDPLVLVELDRYGLGSARSLADYEAFAELDFKARTIKGKSTEQIEAESPVERRRERIGQMFGDIWHNEVWGKGEERSGGGSTLAATAGIRPLLAGLLRFLEIRSMVDIGCGDFGWQGEITSGLQSYIGLDLVLDMIGELERKHGARPGHGFLLRNAALDRPPAADLVLCRDVLTHLSLEEALNVLRQIKASGSRYLVATNFDRGSNKPITMGDWHAIDLTAAPFGLTAPYLKLPEAVEGKYLGVWRVDEMGLEE